MSDSDLGTSSEVPGLHRRTEPPRAKPIPSIGGPLDIYLEDLEQIQDILAADFETVSISVVARGGQVFDADNVATLSELANDRIGQLRFQLDQAPPSRASGWLRILAYRTLLDAPKCDYYEGLGWGAKERECIRQAMTYLRDRCRNTNLRLRRYLVFPAVALTVVGLVLLLANFSNNSAPRSPAQAFSILAETPVRIGLLLWALGLLLFLFSGNQDQIRIIPVFRSTRSTFWRRNRDDLLRGFILVVIGGLVGAVIDRLLK